MRQNPYRLQTLFVIDNVHNMILCLYFVDQLNRLDVNTIVKHTIFIILRVDAAFLQSIRRSMAVDVFLLRS